MTTRLIAGLLAGLVAGGIASGQNGKAASAAGSWKRPMTFADLQRIKRLSDPQISPGGKWVMFSAMDVNLEENSKVSHLWMVPLDGKGAGAQIPVAQISERQLTLWKEGETGGRFSPDGKQILFVSANGGTSSQIYLAPWDETTGRMGSPKRLTNVSTEADGAVWSPDSKRILFVSRVYPECSTEDSWLHEDQCNKRKDEAAAKNPVKAMVFDKLLYRHWNEYVGPKRSHILVVSATDGNAVRDLTPGREITDAEAPTFSLSAPVGYAWAPDSREVAFVTNLDLVPAASTNNDIFTLRLDDPAARPVKISTSPGSDDGPSYSPDGRWIAFRSQARAGYESDRFRLMLFDRQTKTTKELLPNYDRWVDEFVWAPDSKTIYFASGESGQENILSVRLDQPEATSVAAKAEYGDLQISADGRTIVASVMTVRSPATISSIALNAEGHGGSPVVRLTHLNDAVLAELNLPIMENFLFPGAGDTTVQGFLIRPPNFDPAKKYPVKFLIHGGPQGAWGDAWSYRWNPELMAAGGYVVVMVNPRGSTGYGQAFIDGVNGDWGGKAYIDLMKGLDYAEAKYPFIDRTRECALGASYGGFMANWILTHTNRFACIVTHDGMFNPQSAYGTTEELWFNEWEFRELIPAAAKGHAPKNTTTDDPAQPWKYAGRPIANDPFRKWSPLLSIQNARTPTLVVHSQRDYRLDVSEGFQLFTALQRLNVPSKMLYFPDEGHWILKPQNSKFWYEEVGNWCDLWTRTSSNSATSSYVPNTPPDSESAPAVPVAKPKALDQPKAPIKPQPATKAPAPTAPDLSTRTSAPAKLPPPPEPAKPATAPHDQQQTAPRGGPYSITISVAEDEVQVGSDVPIRIVLKNISDHQVLFAHHTGTNNAEFSYRVEVKNAQGRIVEESAYARGLHDAAAQQAGISTVDYIQPGGTAVQTAHLGKLVPLSRPGRYTVQVTRKDLKSNTTVKSNELTLNVVP